jgi:hypothetical protein
MQNLTEITLELFISNQKCKLITKCRQNGKIYLHCNVKYYIMIQYYNKPVMKAKNLYAYLKTSAFKIILPPKH